MMINKIKRYLEVCAIIVTAVCIVQCHKPTIVPEDYERYATIEPPYAGDVQKAFTIAVQEIERKDSDTSDLSWIVMENDTLYLIAFVPRKPIDTVYTDSGYFFRITADGEVDVVVSKRDFKIVKSYLRY